MCGITGYILKSPQACEADTLSRLWQGIRRRGPDDEGGILVYRSRREVRAIVSGRTHQALVASGGKLEPPVPRHDVALFHTRYSIIDLSPAAHQPFRSRDGACWLIFNGEIYNYLELRQLLEAQGVPCRTSSDTEVLAEGWRLWKHGLWPKLNGFWAAALYDATDNSIVLSRDRLGVAPFYYRETARGVYFSSLIAPLLAVEPGGYELDRDSVRGYLDTGLKDHDGTTMYRQVRSLPPATAVTFPQGGEAAILGSDVRTFWTLPEKPWQEKELGFEEAVRQVRSTLVDAVRLRLRADVPLAFELSGGLDSSSVVAAAAEQLDRRLTVYTIQVPGLDESPYARALARRFNLDHRVLSGLEEDLPRDAESFARVMEEPYDTPANYVHHRMLRKIKSDGFHVVLTGAGGDEALAGYEADFWPAAWREWRRGGPGARWQADWYEFCRRFGTVRETRRTLMNYARALAGWVGIKRVVGPEAPSSRALVHLNDYAAAGFFQRRLFHCRVGLLPYYLRSTDHYTMNIPLEHRFPLLDYRLVELGLRLPVPYLFRSGWTKFVLRRAMESYLPSSVLWRRKKMGFPFAFETYFQPRQPALEKYLRVLAEHGFRLPDDGDYTRLARRDPGKLWRMLSTGIWLAGCRGDLPAGHIVT